MTTFAARHPHTTPLRLLDFVVLAIFACALAVVAQSDSQPDPVTTPALSR